MVSGMMTSRAALRIILLVLSEKLNDPQCKRIG
jgi:hypothetical protein